MSAITNLDIPTMVDPNPATQTNPCTARPDGAQTRAQVNTWQIVPGQPPGGRTRLNGGLN